MLEEELRESLKHGMGETFRFNGISYSVEKGTVSIVYSSDVVISDRTMIGAERRLLHFFALLVHERDHIELLFSYDGMKHYLRAEAELAGVAGSPADELIMLEAAPLAGHYRALSFPQFYEDFEDSEEVRVLRRTASPEEGKILIEEALNSTPWHRASIGLVVSLIEKAVSRGLSTYEAFETAPLAFFASALSGRDLRDMIRFDRLTEIPIDFFERSFEDAISLLEAGWLPRRAERLREMLKDLLNSSNLGEIVEKLEGFNLPVIASGREGKAILSFEPALLSFYPDMLFNYGRKRCDLSQACPLNCDGRLESCPLRREWGWGYHPG